LNSLKNSKLLLLLLHIICEHLHDLYTLNSLSGWKGLTKIIPRDSFNSSLYILFSMAINYTESVVHICLLYVDSGLTYIISLLVNSWKCTVQLTEHTGRELSTPLVTCVTWNYRLFTFKTVSSKQMIENFHFPPILEIKILCTSKVFNN